MCMKNILTIEVNNHGHVCGIDTIQYKDGIGCWGSSCIWLRGYGDIWRDSRFRAHWIVAPSAAFRTK